MYGYTGKLLRIDLNDKTVKAEMLDKDKGIKFLGGRGLGTKILMEEVDPKV
ncbi:MAG: aldehyde ferredoxin oxidoreductase N-terminal domain-containing protein, partial [Pseudomonadota bacterium]